MSIISTIFGVGFASGVLQNLLGRTGFFFGKALPWMMRSGLQQAAFGENAGRLVNSIIKGSLKKFGSPWHRAIPLVGPIKSVVDSRKFIASFRENLTKMSKQSGIIREQGKTFFNEAQRLLKMDRATLRSLKQQMGADYRSFREARLKLLRLRKQVSHTMGVDITNLAESQYESVFSQIREIRFKDMGSFAPGKPWFGFKALDDSFRVAEQAQRAKDLFGAKLLANTAVFAMPTLTGTVMTYKLAQLLHGKRREYR